MLSRLDPDYREAITVVHPSFGETATSSSPHWLPFRFIGPATIVGDFFVIMLVSLLSGIGYHWLVLNTRGNINTFLALGSLVFVIFSALTTARQNYRPISLINIGRQLRYTSLNWLFIFALLTTVAFSMKVATDFSRGATFSFFVVGWAGLVVFRATVARKLNSALKNGTFAQRNIILITEHGYQSTSRALGEMLQCGYRPIKTIELASSEVSATGITKSLNEKIREIIATSQAETVDYIFLLTNWHRPQLINNLLQLLRSLPIPVHLLPDQNVATFLAARPGNIGTAFTVELQRAPLTSAERVLKRILDVILAATMLILLSPLMLFTAVLIKLDSDGPILFKQRRNGFNNKTFAIYKFRTMRVLEDGEHIRQATRADPRVTRVGHWLRHTSIDELPQLFNVLKGDMSIVGPRPHAIAHNNEYQEVVANYAFRHHVKPGITGWAQVNGFRGQTQTVDSMAKRVEYDLWYINHWSIWFDLRIILQTMFWIFRQPAAF